ncbi:MAG: SDR family oxidoreductase [Planctomycetes bacterium]|nr:SDR family oxidoreductase [Planctomycetota bacterium]
MELRDKVALITGAGKRVGRAIALRLSRCGCHVAIHYRTSAEDARQTAAQCRRGGVTAEIFYADLTDIDETGKLVPRVVERFGRLDVLINNAAVFEPMSIGTFDLAAWEKALRVNLTAPMILTRAAGDAFRAAGGGRVVNMCDAATQRPWPSHLAYITSKGALRTLTQALARAMAPDVCVTGIAPGVAEWPEDYDQATRDRLAARIPLGRAGTPEEIAAAVCFVLVDGDYLTGTILTIDGGRHLV